MSSSIDDLKSALFWREVVAETLGTLFLTFVGCGSCVSWEDANRVPKSDYNPVVQIAFCFGISVATIVWGIGHISGGHINPAVTSAFLVTRRISIAKAIFFVAAQCCGAVIGAFMLKSVTPFQRWGSLGNTKLNEEMNVGGALGVEFMITFVLVFTVFASIDKNRNDLNGSGPLTIGLSVTMCHLFAIPLTGSSMNSARSFGPAVAMDMWDKHWVYWIGPILGGVTAGLLYEFIFADNASKEKFKLLWCGSACAYKKRELEVYEKTVDTPNNELEDNNNVNEDDEPMLIVNDDRDYVHEERESVL